MSILESLQEYSSLFLSKKVSSFERGLLSKIDLKNKIIGIIGAKGAGKTTLLLQFMKKQKLSSSQMIYISADHPLMSTVSVLEIAKEFASFGGKLMIIDEIHEKDDFASDLKSIWDFLDINVIFSGSSALHLDGADLSRRAVKFTLPTLSFREFLELQTKNRFNSYSLDEILTNHENISQDIVLQIKPLEYFKDYLKFGFYPFYLEDKKTFTMKLYDAINKTIDVDLLKIYNIDPKKLRNIKKLLVMLCVSSPYKPNMTSLSNASELNIKTLYQYLNALNSGKIIRILSQSARGEEIIKKPEKIFLDNPNILNAICQNPQTGTIRECFFASALQNANYEINIPKKGDFLINGNLFEVGGKSKGYNQIKDIKNSFIVADDIQTGFKNKIPLWMFGFLY